MAAQTCPLIHQALWSILTSGPRFRVELAESEVILEEEIEEEVHEQELSRSLPPRRPDGPGRILYPLSLPSGLLDLRLC